MAKAATKSSATTTLAIEQVEVEVGLYKATADARDLVKFDSAGPHGGKLKTEQRAAPVAPSESDGKGDPLGGDPGPELDPAKAEAFIDAKSKADTAAAALVDGEYRNVLVEEGTGEVVEPDQIRKGVRLDDGRFIDCTSQLAAIEERTKLEEMRVVAFIDVGQVPRGRVLASYFLGSQDPAAMPVLKLLHDAMRETRRAAVVRWSARSRQSLGVLVPAAHGDTRTIMALKLAWMQDTRDVPNCAKLNAVQVTDTMREQAAALVRALSDRPVALDELGDEALTLREELHAKALAGEVAEVVEPVTPADAGQDVGAALEASLAAVGGER